MTDQGSAVHRGDNPRVEPYDEESGNELGIAVLAAPDEMTFWRLVADDMIARPWRYGVKVESLNGPGSDEITTWSTFIAVQKIVRAPAWAWYRWGQDERYATQRMTVGVASEGDEGAFFGAVIRLHDQAPDLFRAFVADASQTREAGGELDQTWAARNNVILPRMAVPAQTREPTERPHIRIRYATNGGHTHCSVWSTETGGRDVTHGRNGTLVFRNAEFDAFRELIEAGVDYVQHMAVMGFPGQCAAEFVEDPVQAGVTDRAAIEES